MPRTPQSDAPPFGRRLAALRKERGWSQTHLAEQIGTTRKMIDYYERRATNPSLDVIQRASEVLGVPMSRLLEDEARERKRPGPPPQLMERLERVRRLPRKDQEFILQFLDTYLAKAEKAS